MAYTFTVPDRSGLAERMQTGSGRVGLFSPTVIFFLQPGCDLLKKKKHGGDIFET